MQKVIISEEKIKEFIEKNSNRKTAALEKYKDLIDRLLKENISLNAIYSFIYENDKEIGNKANFYGYIKRNFKLSNSKAQKPKKDKKQIAPPLPKPINQSATSVLSQNFDLLEFPK